MLRRRWRWSAVGLCACLCATAWAAGIAGSVPSVRAATAFATPAFAQQWQAGERLAPNFWGPLTTARDGTMEPYAESTGGVRLVQYFDKGRMESGANGTVTNGLLATELVRGQIQTGDTKYQAKEPPAIPVAGDATGGGVTYAALKNGGAMLFDARPAQLGSEVTLTVTATGEVSGAGVRTDATGPLAVTSWDMVTRHNLPQVFVEYRRRAGVLNIGYAISEPFKTRAQVAGKPAEVVVQVFERRVLTYTAGNPPAFQVEMGNIGQHYAQWRYPGGLPVGAVSPGMMASQATPTIVAGRTTTVAPTRQATVPATVAAPDAAAFRNLLPGGYTVQSVQMVDLGGDGQQQVIFTAEGMDDGQRIEVAGLLIRRGGAWVLDIATPSDASGVASVEAFPKNANHPGFVVFAFHYCGANCNSGFHTVVRYDGDGMTTVVLDGADDRGTPTADAATGKVTLNAPLYRWSDPRCCPAYAYTQTWVWRGTSLVGESLTLRAADSEVGKPLPEWLRSGGVPLFTFLGPLQALDPGTRIAALFGSTVPVRDVAGRTCTASGPALGLALPFLILPGNVYLWPTENAATFRASFTLRTEDRSDPAATNEGLPASITVGSCTLGGRGVGGYVMTIEAQQSGFRITGMQAVDEVYKILPDTAVTVPAVL